MPKTRHKQTFTWPPGCESLRLSASSVITYPPTPAAPAPPQSLLHSFAALPDKRANLHLEKAGDALLAPFAGEHSNPDYGIERAGTLTAQKVGIMYFLLIDLKAACYNSSACNRNPSNPSAVNPKPKPGLSRCRWQPWSSLVAVVVIVAEAVLEELPVAAAVVVAVAVAAAG